MTQSLYKRRSSRVVAAVVVSAAVAGASVLLAAPAQAAPVNSISGTVTADGHPVANAWVYLEHYDPSSSNLYGVSFYDSSTDSYTYGVQTDAAGAFTAPADNLDQGTYLFEIDTDNTSAIHSTDQFSDGHTWQDLNDDVPLTAAFSVASSGAAPSATTFPIQLADNAGALTVNLVDADTLAPVSNSGDTERDVYLNFGVDANGDPVSGSGQYIEDGNGSTVTIPQLSPATYYELSGSATDYNAGTDYLTNFSGSPISIVAGQTASATLPVFSSATHTSVQLPNNAALKIVGTPKVGQVLTTAAPATVATPRYLWTVNDVPDPTQTGATFVPTAKDLNQAIDAVVYYSAPGIAPTRLQSNYTDNVKIGDPNQATVTVGGSAKVGGKLTVAVNGSTVADAKNLVQWYRNGTAIAGADGSSYSVSAADVAQKLSASVTSFAQGHTDALIASNVVTVAKDGAKVAATGTTKVTTKAKPSITISVTDPAGVKATGKVKVQYTKTKSKTVKLNSATGKVKLTLPAYAKAGTYTVKLSYAGDAKHAKASGKITIKVTAAKKAPAKKKK